MLIFKIIKPNNILYIYSSREQRENARLISRNRNLPNRDVLHSILSRDNSLQFITRDKHFDRLKYITISKKPEDFI